MDLEDGEKKPEISILPPENESITQRLGEVSPGQQMHADDEVLHPKVGFSWPVIVIVVWDGTEVVTRRVPHDFNKIIWAANFITIRHDQ